MPAGILAVFNDCAPEGFEHFERWYIREHLQERVGVPGLAPRRWPAAPGCAINQQQHGKQGCGRK